MSKLNIDFSTPCTPSIHAMPHEVQDAGALIRREIQKRYQMASYRSCAVESAATLGAPLEHTSRIADEAGLTWQALQDAYHAWARTAGEMPLTADMSALLRSTWEAAQ